MVVRPNRIYDHLRRLDLNLLTILYVLLDERSVSRAANRLALTQPAVSRALQRLRDQFGDLILVRVGRTMLPTAFAEALIEPLATTLQHVAILTKPRLFDPASAQRRYRIATSDAATESVILPLLRRLQTTAPGISFSISPMTADVLNQARDGEFDFILDSYSSPLAGFRIEQLFHDRFVCIARKDHPSIKTKLSRAYYEAATHIQVAGTAASLIVLENALAELGMARQVVIELPNFLAALAIVAQTDHLLTIPSGPARRTQRQASIAIFELPFPIRSFPLSLLWHQRADSDQGHRWLRREISSLFAGHSA